MLRKLKLWWKHYIIGCKHDFKVIKRGQEPAYNGLDVDFLYYVTHQCSKCEATYKVFDIEYSFN